jgi:redox-sensitive bicupin YhaK (pirin superfamily)
MYATYLTKGKKIKFEVHKNRQAYLVLLEGNARINDIALTKRDALEITEENIEIHSIDDAHIAVMEMAKQ